MRKVVLTLAVTLDGFIEGPNGEMDWLVRDETIDFAEILTDILADKDAVFYGRISYEKWGNFRPDNGSEQLKAAYDLLHGMQQQELAGVGIHSVSLCIKDVCRL